MVTASKFISTQAYQYLPKVYNTRTTGNVDSKHSEAKVKGYRSEGKSSVIPHLFSTTLSSPQSSKASPSTPFRRDVSQRHINSLDINQNFFAIVAFVNALKKHNAAERRQFIHPYRNQLQHYVIQHAREFSPKQLARLAVSFTSMGIFDKRLFDALSAAACKKIGDFQAEDLVLLAIGFANAKMDDTNLISLIRDRALLKIKDFSPSQLADLACSFAMLLFEDRDLFEEINDAMVSKIKQFKYSDLCRLALSFKIVNQKLLNYDVLLAQLNASDEKFSERAMLNLYYGCLGQENLDSDEYSVVQKKMAERLATRKTQLPLENVYKSIGLALDQMKIRYTLARSILGFDIGILLKIGEKSIAIHIDQPSDFLQSGGLGGLSYLKHVALEENGVRVMHISLTEWQAMKCLKDKKTYLTKKLAELLDV